MTPLERPERHAFRAQLAGYLRRRANSGASRLARTNLATEAGGRLSCDSLRPLADLDHHRRSTAR
jgi:hypothetical protein